LPSRATTSPKANLPWLSGSDRKATKSVAGLPGRLFSHCPEPGW
jgi:hypothetical protein